MQLRAAMDSAESAQATKATLDAALAVLRKLFAENKQEFAAMLGQVHPHVAKLADVADESIKTAKVETEKSSVDVIVTTGDALATWVRGAGPLIEAMKDRARDNVRLNQMKNIGLAMHNYHDVYGRFPAAAICDDAGKPLLSWRVAILPYIEHADLYDKFHLDEPWDSPHNKKLIDRMPDVYRRGDDQSTTKTGFVVYTGDETAFTVKAGRKYADFEDGLSETLLCVEVAPDKAVTWTKPEDLVFDPADPKTCLGLGKTDRFIVLFGDGATRWLPASLDAGTLRKLLERADGGVIELPDSAAPPPPPPVSPPRAPTASPDGG